LAAIIGPTQGKGLDKNWNRLDGKKRTLTAAYKPFAESDLRKMDYFEAVQL
jgi:hypothetical protein